MVSAYLDATRIDPVRPLAEHETQSHEGGIVTKADNWTRLRRFLILGSEGGSFYASERELSLENVTAVTACLNEDGERAVAMIAAISRDGLAPKNEPALFALALALRHANVATRRAAAAVFGDVVRTGTHLLHAAAYVKATGGGKKSNRIIRRAFADWFLTKNAEQLAYQAVKYQQRDGWSLADVLRLAHPKTDDADRNAVMKWIVDGEITPGHVPLVIAGRNALHEPDIPLENVPVEWSRERRAVSVIRSCRVPREAIPSELLNSADVWDALLEDMPMTAMIRNLAKMTSVGLLTNDITNAATLRVTTALGDVERLRKARIHPIALLAALKVYEQGHGEKGSLSWTPAKRIITALDEAFYLAFTTIKPSGKNICLALDVSSSMDGSKVNGIAFLSAREASAAMALVTAATEPNHAILAYSRELIDITGKVRPSMRLDEVIRTVRAIPFGGTICSLPIQAAMQSHAKIDAFVSYTDSETADGGVRFSYDRRAVVSDGSVSDYLNRYRAQSGIPARHVVVATTSNGFSIADPNDPLALDVAGFSADTPAVIADFIAGRI